MSHEINSKNDISISSSRLNDISFGVDWHTNNENIVRSKMDDIINVCKKIVLSDNQNFPRVFALRDNIFVFTDSLLTTGSYGEFTGDWLIFEWKNNEFKIRAVMEFE
ncbi:hypothetical protein O9H85_04110 [Paenibacillus filicis]|uniref:Uncharacterized protein n=1 Tax=Paenibacillus gyeongsangnamensis TaxID=3388067 RepID=A0ABT4Q421_9BACL|nr:hypothetical protein [Paenibacillus filicis]MCZ8511628.1 hypothetical protein [Paenibacillus filicis]